MGLWREQGRTAQDREAAQLRMATQARLAALVSSAEVSLVTGSFLLQEPGMWLSVHAAA